MYVGRIVAVARAKSGEVAALYRVSSRSFPNREAKQLGNKVAILPRAGHEQDIFKNPYIAYNCLALVGGYAIVTNGSHTDIVAEKVAAGYAPRDALATVLHAMDYEHDSLDTPRIAAIVHQASAQGWLGIVTAQTLHVARFALVPGEAFYVTTYERTLPSAAQRDGAFHAASAADACQYVLGRGVFADFERPITAACAFANPDGSYQVALADAPR
jgi:IMP cyclohydrolase